MRVVGGTADGTGCAVLELSCQHTGLVGQKGRLGLVSVGAGLFPLLQRLLVGGLLGLQVVLLLLQPLFLRQKRLALGQPAFRLLGLAAQAFQPAFHPVQLGELGTARLALPFQLFQFRLQLGHGLGQGRLVVLQLGTFCVLLG